MKETSVVEGRNGPIGSTVGPKGSITRKEESSFILNERRCFYSPAHGLCTVLPYISLPKCHTCHDSPRHGNKKLFSSLMHKGISLQCSMLLVPRVIESKKITLYGVVSAQIKQCNSKE